MFPRSFSSLAHRNFIRLAEFPLVTPKRMGTLHYAKEMLAILHVVDLWHPYLLGQHFQIKRDHQRLKHFLEQ
jgi:hypothetical protein